MSSLGLTVTVGEELMRTRGCGDHTVMQVRSDIGVAWGVMSKDRFRRICSSGSTKSIQQEVFKLAIRARTLSIQK
eukprot:527097-Amphidinium_carterae.1